MSCDTHDSHRAALQLNHLAQMKSLYPEVFSLRYANIPKTNVEFQCTGTQLIIDMSLSDPAAEPVSTAKLSQASSHASQPSAAKVRQPSAEACAAAPSSTQAVLKSGSAAVAGAGGRDLESVSKLSCSNSVEAGAEHAQVPLSPSEPGRLLAVKAEFERRLEKQVWPTAGAHAQLALSLLLSAIIA